VGSDSNNSFVSFNAIVSTTETIYRGDTFIWCELERMEGGEAFFSEDKAAEA
jgi:hypothetical protein